MLGSLAPIRVCIDLPWLVSVGMGKSEPHTQWKYELRPQVQTVAHTDAAHEAVGNNSGYAGQQPSAS